MLNTLISSLALAATVAGQSIVKGKAFDRIAIIWLENTDYELAYVMYMYEMHVRQTLTSYIYL